MNIPIPGEYIPPQKPLAPRNRSQRFSEQRELRSPMTHKPFAGSRELEDLKNSLETSAPKYKSRRNNKENNR